MRSLAFLLTRRWILLALAVVLLSTLAWQLGDWQFRRLEDRKERNATTLRNEDAAPVPVTDVLAPGRLAHAQLGDAEPLGERLALVGVRRLLEQGARPSHVLCEQRAQLGAELDDQRQEERLDLRRLRALERLAERRQVDRPVAHGPGAEHVDGAQVAGRRRGPREPAPRVEPIADRVGQRSARRDSSQTSGGQNR